VYVKPFIDWIWFGCLFMAFGGILAATDKRYRMRSKQEQSEPTQAVGAQA
jgi:cytochrome c-type biogenesis protein CcmF